VSAERGETTALVVAIPEAEPVVGPWRDRYCADAVARGIPPHITILVPLVPRTEVDDALLGSLRALFAPIPPFAYELARLESFPGVAWLAPEPSAPFHDLIERACSAFPDHPPYGDPALEPVPHCTIGVDDDPLQVTAMLDELRASLAPELPIRCRASSVDLLEEREDGAWTLRATFLLQGPP
jgi:2'-5' RNA ligase